MSDDLYRLRLFSHDIYSGEVVRENGRYWIMTVNGPQWFDIDEREVDPALNYLFLKKRQQQEQSSQ